MRFKFLLGFLVICGTFSLGIANQNSKIIYANQQAEGRQSPPQKAVSKKLNLAEKNPVAALLCKGIRAFTGTIAKIIALIMLIGLAVNLFSATTYNPVNPVTVVSLIVGITVLFTADTIIGKIFGDAGMGGQTSCDCKYGISTPECDESI
jgi:type IV secretory pathway VirB2 component (pilin)